MDAKVNHVVTVVAFLGVLLLSGCQAVSLNSVITAPDGNVYRVDSVLQSNAPLAAVEAASVASEPAYMWDYETEHADSIQQTSAQHPADRYFDKDNRPPGLPGGR